MSRYLMASCLVTTSLLACDVPRSDMLEIVIDSDQLPVRIDTTDWCARGDCDATVVDAALIHHEIGFISELAWVEMLQFRVDFTLDGVGEDDQPPYFAGEFRGPHGLVAGVAEEVPFAVQAAGQQQRDWVADRWPGTYRPGEAVVTLAGYDDTNEIVQVSSASFAVSFGDYSGVAR